MKKRHGFVSNSSSSSFTCCICGARESGWDASWSDFGWNCCEHDHQFCCDALKVDYDKVKEFKKEYLIKDITEYAKKYPSEEYDKQVTQLKEGEDFLEECWDEWTEGANICELECPVCQFEAPDYGEIAKYLLKEYSIPRDEIFAEVKAKNKRRKKLYDLEYVDTICERKGITVDILIKQLKEEFTEYNLFLDSLRSK